MAADKILGSTCRMLAEMGVSDASQKPLATVLLALGLALVLSAVYLVLSRVVEKVLRKVAERTETLFDDVVLRHEAMRWIWALVLVLITMLASPVVLGAYASLLAVAETVLRVVMVLTIMMIAIETIHSVFQLMSLNVKEKDPVVNRMYQALAREDGDPIKTSAHSLHGLEQMIVIIICIVGVVVAISTLIGRDPLLVFSGLGAMSAVLLLVFQDSILGVVAGLQISANDMLQPGDWIMVPKYGANGVVKEVTLAAVKVRNWDKTIVTIPPYKLLTEGFQNWRGMWLSKGRRVTRSLCIDMTTVRFATAEETERWSREPWWRQPEGDGRVVNVTAFRMYLEHFIATVPTLVPNLLSMVRELQPTAEGLPIELYFFTSNIEWSKYEAVQADVTDRVLAALPEFGLRIFQHPTGRFEAWHSTQK